MAYPVCQSAVFPEVADVNQGDSRDRHVGDMHALAGERVRIVIDMLERHAHRKVVGQTGEKPFNKGQQARAVRVVVDL
jgi:hypothetical protein